VPTSGGQRNNFGQILTFWGLLYRLPFTDEDQIWRSIADQWHTLICKIWSRSVYSDALCWRKTPIFAVFGLWHLVLSPIDSILRKVNTGAQLQTFPYSTTSKSFLYSKALMAKSGTQSLRFKSMTNKDRQTDKKVNVFGHPGAGEIQSPPDLAR